MSEPTESPNRLSERTTPTWEMELLVSGATIFGLLQLPELLDHAYFRAVNGLPGEYAGMMLPLWVYAKVGVVTLALTFTLHLFLRGYWVALVGMNSVYPGGIRWPQLGLGPIARARLAETAPPMSALIERADNRATRVFGVGFGVAMMMIVPVVLVLLSLVIGAIVDTVLGEGHLVPIFVVVMVALLGPWFIAHQVDRRIGARLDPASRLSRLIGRVQAHYSRLGFGTRSNPLVALFASNVGRVKFAAIMFPLALLLTLTLTLQAGGVKGRAPLGLFQAANDPLSANASLASFYGDTRGDGWSLLPMPFIASRTVQGAYVELFAPYVPRLHGPALRAACPQAASPTASNDNEKRLACLARLLDIQIDGQPLAVRLDASSDPGTGQPGVLAMLPVATLPAGRHDISLIEPGTAGAPARRLRIPFWK